MSGVYAIVNAVTGRIYVGATEGPMKQRVERHYSLLRRGKHFIPDMQREWEQHGSDVYAWRALESVIGGPIALRQRESHWLAEFAAKGASLYNRLEHSTLPIVRGPLVPGMLTVKEVAERMRVAPKTVRRWITDGGLHGILPGGTKTGYRIRESELERFLKERER